MSSASSRTVSGREKGQRWDMGKLFNMVRLKLAPWSEGSPFGEDFNMEGVINCFFGASGGIYDGVHLGVKEGGGSLIAVPSMHKGIYTISASSKEYGFPTNRDPTTETTRPPVSMKSAFNTKFAYCSLEIAKKIVVYQLLCFCFEKYLKEENFTRSKQFDFEELCNLNVFQWYPTFQWVLPQEKQMPILDLDDLPNGVDDLELFLEFCKDYFVEGVKIVVGVRRDRTTDKFKAHIYFITLWLTTAEIIRMIATLSKETGIPIDSSMYTSKHTLRVMGNKKNGEKVNPGRCALSDLFDSSSVSTFDPLHSDPELVKRLVEIRQECTQEQCRRIFRTARSDPLLDTDPGESDVLRTTIFCVSCCIKVWHEILEAIYPFRAPAKTDSSIITTLASSKRTRNQDSYNVNRSETSPVIFTSPFETMSSGRRTGVRMTEFHDLLRKKFDMPLCSSVAEALDNTWTLLDKLCHFISSFFAGRLEKDTVYFLGFDDKGNFGIQAKPSGKILTLANFPDSLTCSFIVEDADLGVCSVISALDHTLMSGIKVSLAKGSDSTVVFNTTALKLINIVISRNLIDTIRYRPFNRLVHESPEIKNNVFTDPRADVYTDYYLDSKDLVRFFNDFSTFFDLMFKYMFYNPQRGWDHDKCLEAMLFFLRFVCMRVRFPGGSPFPEYSYTFPDLNFWFFGCAGSGKSKLIILFLSKLFILVSSVSSIDGRFDASYALAEKLFALFDEGEKITYTSLKRCTNKRVTVERKYLHPEEIDNYCSIIVVCNLGGNISEVINTLDVDDRRLVVQRTDNIMPDHLGDVAPNILETTDFAEILFYFMSVGFPDDLSEYDLSPVACSVVDAINSDIARSRGTREEVRGLFREWGAAKAPFSPSKYSIMQRVLPAPIKFILKWVETGTNISAGFKGLLPWIRNNPNYWDRHGAWCKIIPIQMVHGLYSAFTGAATATSNFHWEDKLRQFFLPSDPYLYDRLDLSEFLEYNDLSRPALISSTEDTYIYIPTFEQAVANFHTNANWNWSPPISPYLPLGHPHHRSHYSHAVVRQVLGLTKPVSYSDTGRLIPTIDNMDFSNQDCATWGHVDLAMIGVLYHTVYFATQQQKRLFDALLFPDVVEELRQFRSGEGLYEQPTTDPNALRRTLSMLRKRDSPTPSASSSQDQEYYSQPEKRSRILATPPDPSSQ
jgi:hypothetical protein